MRKTTINSKSSGFTLIELLVTISIIGILIAIGLPALQKTRESSRKVFCINNLRQICIATNHYVSSYQVMPSIWLEIGGKTVDPTGNNDITIRQYSIFSQILPYLEQNNAYDNINFSVNLNDYYVFNRGIPPIQNQTILQSKINTFICPSDPAIGRVNYRANWGSDRWAHTLDSPFSNFFKQISPSMITDGLSNTCAFSEKLSSPFNGGANFNRYADFCETNFDTSLSQPEYINACSSIIIPPAVFRTGTGQSWVIGTFTQTLYNHMDIPNSSVVDCGLGGFDPVVGNFTARSYHGGVNVAFCDGSVRFFADTLNRAFWRSLGTRNGGEINDGL